MVKLIDENDLQSIDHIGVALWRAAGDWKRRFATEMAKRGYPWHAEARGAVLAHLGPSGRGQTQLVAAMGLTKQAVQQFLDQLEQEGVLRRVADPSDKRARRVELTELGLEDFRARNSVKRLIEDEYRQKLGATNFEHLMRVLADLAQ